MLGIVGNLPNLKVGAAGSITGTTFQDFNGNSNFDTDGGTAAAYFKRFVGFGSGANGNYGAPPNTGADDTSAIYVVNPATNAVAGIGTGAGIFAVPGTDTKPLECGG